MQIKFKSLSSKIFILPFSLSHTHTRTHHPQHYDISRIWERKTRFLSPVLYSLLKLNHTGMNVIHIMNKKSERHSSHCFKGFKDPQECFFHFLLRHRKIFFVKKFKLNLLLKTSHHWCCKKLIKRWFSLTQRLLPPPVSIEHAVLIQT